MNMKMICIVAAAALLGLAVQANAQDMCIREGWKIEAGEYFTLELGTPSFGTFFNTYEHKEYFWVHHKTSIDFYDLTDKQSFDAMDNPTLSYSIPSGSICNQASSLILGEDVVTFHGDRPFCTCNWTPDKPCPSRLRLTINGVDEDLVMASNALVSVDTVVPNMVGPVALGQGTGADGTPPNWGCTGPFTNAADVAGKVCVVDRGGCFFQDKYDNCMAAGALGTIVVNRDDSIISMGVTDIERNTVMIMIGKSNGQKIKDAVNGGLNPTLSAGRTVGPLAPVPLYSNPDPLGVVNVYTGKRDLDTAPFLLADNLIYDYKRQLLYALTVDGNTPEYNLVMNTTTSVGGTWPVLGGFQSGADGSDIQLMFRGDKTYLIEDVVWDKKAYIYDVTDTPADPILLSTIEFKNFCPEAGFDGVNIHPTQPYLYLASGIRETACGDFDGDGVTGDYVQEIWNVVNPANPIYMGGFMLNDIDFGALTMNGYQWVWGPNDIAMIPGTSSGALWYDFSNPTNPVKYTDRYDPTVASLDFTKGVFSGVYGDDGYWYLLEKDGDDGAHSIFHQIQLVDCALKDICYN